VADFELLYFVCKMPSHTLKPFSWKKIAQKFFRPGAEYLCSTKGVGLGRLTWGEIKYLKVEKADRQLNSLPYYNSQGARKIAK